MLKRTLTTTLAATGAMLAVATLAVAMPASAYVDPMPAEPPPFRATIEPISPELAQEMIGVSWEEGCPVPIEDLRLVSMNHWGFDDASHDGELVVHEDVAEDVAGVFGQLYEARFPIRRMERIEHYGGSDDASMAADNTSAFNCRAITGGTRYSIHSYGKAIDINTIENPYVSGDLVLPPAGADYLDRDNVRPGMILAKDFVVKAFKKIGFKWGGYWDDPIDYQHFEAKVKR